MGTQVKSCSLKFLDGSCSPETFSRSALTVEQADLLRRRSGVARVDAVCERHRNDVLQFYPLRQTKCCDPFSKHKKTVSSGLIEIKSSIAEVCEVLGVLSASLISGKKLCMNCHSALKKRIDTYQDSLDHSNDKPAPKDVSCFLTLKCVFVVLYLKLLLCF